MSYQANNGLMLICARSTSEKPLWLQCRLSQLANGVSPQYVCDCLKGRREIGESIARPLGMMPVTVYISTNLADNVFRDNLHS